MSDHLKTFLRAYLDWVDDGAPDHDIFIRSVGLCSSFRWWLQALDFDRWSIAIEVDHLMAIFEGDGLDSEYPFGGKDSYIQESIHEEAHLNETRLAWVRSKVQQFEAA